MLTGEEWTAVGFALGVVELVRTDAEDTVVGHLGPDLLGPDWDPAEAARRLASDPSRALADALLDQRNLAGIGNLYKSELCFLSGHHPLHPGRCRRRPRPDRRPCPPHAVRQPRPRRADDHR